MNKLGELYIEEANQKLFGYKTLQEESEVDERWNDEKAVESELKDIIKNLEDELKEYKDILSKGTHAQRADIVAERGSGDWGKMPDDLEKQIEKDYEYPS